jgi:hypothetical protein
VRSRPARRTRHVPVRSSSAGHRARSADRTLLRKAPPTGQEAGPSGFICGWIGGERCRCDGMLAVPFVVGATGGSPRTTPLFCVHRNALDADDPTPPPFRRPRTTPGMGRSPPPRGRAPSDRGVCGQTPRTA